MYNKKLGLGFEFISLSLYILFDTKVFIGIQEQVPWSRSNEFSEEKGKNVFA